MSIAGTGRKEKEMRAMGYGARDLYRRVSSFRYVFSPSFFLYFTNFYLHLDKNNATAIFLPSLPLPLRQQSQHRDEGPNDGRLGLKYFLPFFLLTN